MKAINFITRFLVVFGVTLFVAILVTSCWNYLAKGNALIIDWETSLRIASVFAVVIPLTQIKRK
jgi:hypothetical protein